MVTLWFLAMIASLSAARAQQNASTTAANPNDLRVVIYDDPSWWPMGRRIKGTNDFEGYEPAIARSICDKLNVTCKWVPTFNTDARLELINNGSADLALAGITVTPEREKLADFIQPYYYSSNFQIYAPKDSVDESKGWDGLAGQPVCVYEGSVTKEIANRLLLNPVMIPIADEAASKKMVLDDIDNGVCIGVLEEYLQPTLYDVLTAVNLPAQSANPDSPTYLGMAVAKDNEALKKNITAANLALFEGGANSEILALEKEWLIPNGLKANAGLAADVAAISGEANAPGSTPPSSGSASIATKPYFTIAFALASIIGAGFIVI